MNKGAKVRYLQEPENEKMQFATANMQVCCRMKYYFYICMEEGVIINQ